MRMTNQMELGIEQRARAKSEAQREAAQRAQWWFKQMRRVVNGAMEWKPERIARPEQVHMSLGELKP